MKYLYFFTFICFSTPCQTINKDTKEVSLFIIPECKDDFLIQINENKEFSTYQIDKRPHGPQELIAKITTSTNKLNIFLRIFNKDTAFIYELGEVDSLFFGLTIDTSAFVVQNETEYIDYYD